MSRGLQQKIPSCPACGASLAVPPQPEELGVLELSCSSCGGLFRVRKKQRTSSGDVSVSSTSTRDIESAAPPGGLELRARLEALRGLRWLYCGVTVAGAGALLIAGGFVPVLKAWLAEEPLGWTGLVSTLGGFWPRPPSKDPDADYGPALAPADAPGLFQQVQAVSKELGVRSPRQLRVSYLPCCGVTTWGRQPGPGHRSAAARCLDPARARAVLAHELAHLALGDTTSSARSVRFVESLAQGLETQEDQIRGPLGAWARLCHRAGSRLLAPVSRGQEIRADRAAASIAGGSAAASALIQVALVQSLFREVLEHYDAADHGQHNLYAFFRAFWARLPAPCFSRSGITCSVRRSRLSIPRAPTPRCSIASKSFRATLMNLRQETSDGRSPLRPPCS